MPVRQGGSGLGGQLSGLTIWRERPATTPYLTANLQRANSIELGEAGYGPEMLPWGRFGDNQTDPWVTLGDGPLTAEEGRLRLTGAATGGTGANTVINGLTIGQRYRFRAKQYPGPGHNKVGVYIRGAVDEDFFYYVVGSTIDYTFTASTTSLTINFFAYDYSGGGYVTLGQYSEIDDVSLKAEQLAIASYTPAVSGGISLGGTSPSAKTRVPTASGGLQMGGASATRTLVIRAATVSGGIQYGGTAGANKTRKASVSGGIVFAGTSTRKRIKSAAVSGGLVFGGVAGLKRTKAALLSGGMVFGGAAATSFVAGGAIWIAPAPTGGVQLAGTANTARARAALVGGGVQFGGEAASSLITVGTGTVHRYTPTGGVQVGGRGFAVFRQMDPWQSGVEQPQPADWVEVAVAEGSWVVQDPVDNDWEPVDAIEASGWTVAEPATGTWS